MFLPLTDTQDYDLVADIDCELKKVQVRTTRHVVKSGHYAVNLRVLGGNRSGTGIVKLCSDIHYDLLFVVTANGAQYLIPKSDLADIQNQLTLNASTEKYKVA